MYTGKGVGKIVNPSADGDEVCELEMGDDVAAADGSGAAEGKKGNRGESGSYSRPHARPNLALEIDPDFCDETARRVQNDSH